MIRKKNLSIIDCFKQARKKISRNKLIYLVLFSVLCFSAFLRLYKLNKLLGFWYDQGRDALVIWDLLHYNKFFLIGPVTGIEGIFLGPFYYYLIAPFYWIGKGSPVFVAAVLAWLSVGAIFLVYWLGKAIYGRKIGLISAFIYGLSYEVILFSRWLANPNPLPFFSLLVIVFIWLSLEKNENFFIFTGLLIGLCLQLEAAAAAFFLPAVLAVIVWQKKKLCKLNILLPTFFLFFCTLAPQIIFNFRHQGILVSAFKKFLITEKSFGLSFFQVGRERLNLYFNVFLGKLFPQYRLLGILTAIVFFFSAAVKKKKVFGVGGKLLMIWILSPLLGFLFYQGNHGYVWDYYFSGVIPFFIILLSASLTLICHRVLGKIFLVAFLVLYSFVNMRLVGRYYQKGIGITLEAETKALDWIYQDAQGKKFNVDIYVPPNIYFSYSYLFKWYGWTKYGYEPEVKLINNLYTLSEVDSERPFLLNKWLQRQDGIGKIVKSYSWEGISVEQRERIKFED